MNSKLIRTFTRDELEDLDIPHNRKLVVHDEQIDEGRWETHHVCVFRTEDDGPLWQVGYQKPATESQECDRWYSEDPVSATQVEPYEVTVTKYRPVSDPVLTSTEGEPARPIEHHQV